MGESYFERRGCLMNNLTLSGFFDPLPHGIWVVALWNILPSHRRFRKYPCPSYSRESEGPCSSAGVQGAGPQPEREGRERGRERERERIALHGPLPLSENQETPTTASACSSGGGVCPLRTSSPHWSSKVTRRWARTLLRPRCKVRTWLGR